MSVPLATLLVTSLASYLAIVHLASFSPDLAYARSASKVAFLLMDGLLIAHVVAGRRGLSAALSFARPRRAAYVWAAGLALLAVLAVIGLHADYLAVILGGSRRGVAGSAAGIKNWLVVSQVALVVALAAAQRAMSGDVANPGRRLGRNEFALLLLPAVPLANYFLRNRGEFTAVGAVEYFALLLLLPAALLFGAHALQRLLGAPAVAAPIVAGLAFVHYSMPMVMAWLHRPVETAFAVQLSLALGLPGLLILLYRVRPDAVATAVVLFSTASITATAAAGPAPGEDLASAANELTAPAGAALARALAAPAVRRPDVYVLVYDSYPPPSMLQYYGIDNTATQSLLAARGFTNYPRASSLFLMTRGSMGWMLNMGVPGDVRIGGPTESARFFEAQGYETHLILSAYLLKGNARIHADTSFPPPRVRSGLDMLYRGIAGGEFKSELVFEDSPREEWLAAKRDVLAAPDGPPRMVYAHSGLPGHSQNSGACRPDETRRYAGRLKVANAELRADVETILATARDAIIIVAGDHGPSLTGDCLHMYGTPAEQLTAVDLADRYGVNLSIRWPSPQDLQIDTLQHVLVAVASYMLDDPAVFDHRASAETEGYGGIPDGAVKDGIVTIGPDKGKPLLPVRQ